jgi:hypothetical protein
MNPYNWKSDYIPLMQQQFVITNWDTILQEAKKLGRSLIDQHWRMLCFYENMWSNFCGYILTGVFVNQLSSNARISVWRMVWVTTSWYLMSDILPRLVARGKTSTTWQNSPNPAPTPIAATLTSASVYLVYTLWARSHRQCDPPRLRACPRSSALPPTAHDTSSILRLVLLHNTNSVVLLALPALTHLVRDVWISKLTDHMM